MTDGTELIVHISNRALDVGHRHDGVLVESELLVGQFLERPLAGNKAFLQGLFGSLAFRDIVCNF